VQEVVNAREALVYCGKKSVSAQAFVVGYYLIKDGLSESERHKSILDDSTRNQSIEDLMDFMPGPWRHDSSQDGEDLCTLLSRFAHTEATLERDKIYA
jgi:hypothetical protein